MFNQHFFLRDQHIFLTILYVYMLFTLSLNFGLALVEVYSDNISLLNSKLLLPPQSIIQTPLRKNITT